VQFFNSCVLINLKILSKTCFRTFIHGDLWLVEYGRKHRIIYIVIYFQIKEVNTFYDKSKVDKQEKKQNFS